MNSPDATDLKYQRMPGRESDSSWLQIWPRLSRLRRGTENDMKMAYKIRRAIRLFAIGQYDADCFDIFPLIMMDGNLAILVLLDHRQ